MTTRRSLLQFAAFWPFVVPRDFETTGRIPPIQPLAATAKTVTSSGLSGMLELVPASFDLGEPLHFRTQYANFAAQSAAVGIPVPERSDQTGMTRWSEAVFNVFFGVGIDGADHPIFFTDVFSELGFNALDLNEFLALGTLDEWTFFCRGMFDAAQLIPAWEASGFRPLQVGNQTAWTLPSTADDADVSAAASKVLRVHMNNAITLPDGTLLFTSSRQTIQNVLAVAAGRKPSLATRVDIAPLLRALSSNLCGAVLLDGAQLSWSANISRFASAGGAPQGIPKLVETFLGTGELPPIAFAVFGITPGGPIEVSETETLKPPAVPQSRFEIALMMQTREDAEAAVPVVKRRVDQLLSYYYHRPWTEMIEMPTFTVASPDPVLLLQTSFVEGFPLWAWTDIPTEGDFPFLFWGPMR
jgi:hypothetical protein